MSVTCQQGEVPSKEPCQQENEPCKRVLLTAQSLHQTIKFPCAVLPEVSAQMPLVAEQILLALGRCARDVMREEGWGGKCVYR